MRGGNNLSRYPSYVRRGGGVRVFDRDRAIAELDAAIVAWRLAAGSNATTD